jgi:hypothetical protein
MLASTNNVVALGQTHGVVVVRFSSCQLSAFSYQSVSIVSFFTKQSPTLTADS